jgi:hypothetical protein
MALDNRVQAELTSRLRAGKLSGAAIELVAASATSPAAGRNSGAYFADNFALEAWRSGAISEAAMRRVLRRQLEFRSVLTTDPTPTCIPYQPMTSVYLQSPRSPLTYEVTNRACTINGTDIPASCIGNTLMSEPSYLSPLGDVIRLPSPLLAGLVKVKMTAHVAVTLTITDRPTLTEADDVTVIDGATKLGVSQPREFMADPAPDADMDATAAVITLSPAAADPTATRLDVRFTTKSGNLFAGDALIRTRDGKERKLGQVVIQSGVGSVSATVPPPALDPVFEIVLRPTNDLAAETEWTVTTYQHEIVIAAPTIVRDDPARK